MRKSLAPALAVVGLLVAAQASSCKAPLDGAPCPCLDGYVCDEAVGVCIENRAGDSSIAFDAGWDGSAPEDGATESDSGLCTEDCPADAAPDTADSGPEADAG
jgi:hypothetical protein